MDRKRELKQKYKQMKPEMGIFAIKSKSNNKYYIEANSDVKSKINRAKFQLDFGSYPNRELQKEWKEFGETNFDIEILEKLEYDKDESKIDYKEELQLLQMIWEEKLLKEKKEFYKK